ncbi:unnamed protein product [Cunninghamella blakesleeana]
MKGILTIDNVLVNLGQYISIRDIVHLSWTCKLLNERIFSNEKIWQQRNLIFQPQDDYWTQHPIKTIQQLLLKIPRYHGLTQLILDSPHSIPNLFFILDQYAHCVQHVQLSFHLDPSQLFCQHLESFTYHLMNLQLHHQMPLTFQQYGSSLNDNDHSFQLKSSHPSFEWNAMVDPLDDPPFESLHSFHFEIISSSSEKEKASFVLNKIKHLIPLLSRKQSKEIKITTNIKVIASPLAASPLSTSSISSSNSHKNNTKPTLKRKRKKQQQTTEEKKEENYYKKIHYLSHQLIERQQQVSQSCQTTYLTNQPQSVVSSTTSTIPIIHVMRCKKLSN